MARTCLRVVCGLSDTIEIFSPQIALTRLDLPTFGRPTSVTKPDLMTGPGYVLVDCEIRVHMWDAGDMPRSHQPLDFRKWFDRMQPQTLQIATWLLYINGFFALIGFLGSDDWIGIARSSKGLLGVAVGLVVIAGYVAGGFLMANDRRLGYRLALVGAFSPFALRIWILWGYDFGLFDIITGRNFIGFLFDVALCALLLHRQSREHERLWFS